MPRVKNKSKDNFLTKEEEIELGYFILDWREDKENEEKYKKALDAVHKLYFANERFALKKAIDFVYRTQTNNYSIESAKTDARIGLLETIWRYDPRRGAKITTASQMSIYKKLFLKCNIDENHIPFKDFANVDFAKAKKDYKESGLENQVSMFDFVLANQDKYKNLREDNFYQVYNILQGVSSLDYTLNDSDGHAMEFKDVIEDKNALNFITYYDEKNRPENFSPEILEKIELLLTDVEKQVMYYEFNDCAKQSKEDFIASLNLTSRKYTVELNKGIKKLRNFEEEKESYIKKLKRYNYSDEEIEILSSTKNVIALKDKKLPESRKFLRNLEKNKRNCINFVKPQNNKNKLRILQ